MELLPIFSFVKINHRMDFIFEQTIYNETKAFDLGLFFVLGFTFNKTFFQNFNVKSWYMFGILDGMFVRTADSFTVDVYTSNTFTIVTRFENCV